MIVYLARDILPFVMYCIYGESGSSLLIESTDYMIYYIIIWHRVGRLYKSIVMSQILHRR